MLSLVNVKIKSPYVAWKASNFVKSEQIGHIVFEKKLRPDELLSIPCVYNPQQLCQFHSFSH